MKIYHISHTLTNVSGNVWWSETKERRKPDRNAKRWHPTDSNGVALGPFPEHLKKTISDHWALTDSINSKLPDYFQVFTSRRFTGIPMVGEKMMEIFLKYSSDDLELFRVPNFWSIADMAEIEQPFYFANLCGSEFTIDVKKSNTIKILNPILKMAQPYAISRGIKGDIVLVENFTSNKNVWRDEQTLDWFCNDEFKTALEIAWPSYFQFLDVSENQIN